MNRAFSGRRLLIVDDDDALRQILSWAFEDMDYRVRAAADYRSAIGLVRTADFDCALLDYRLPDGNGHRLAQVLRELQPDVRIVLMSCDRAAATGEIAGRPEAAGFVDKPVRLAALHHLFSDTGASVAAVAPGPGRNRG